VGQLAGGIAHDFNNLLTVILGYSKLVAESLGEVDPRFDSVNEITAAAERAAALTQQLLAFSRKEIVRPQTIDLNQAVPDLLKLLRRMLRESIEFEVELTRGAWSTNIDRSQLEQAIVNLAVNAGDAMPRGGTLRVSTENRVVDEDDARLRTGLVAGEYVVLSVTDTGEGMVAEVAARAFEPFFTTKPRGSGTGLGLATVYGIVTQAGGHVDLRSDPGHGTTATVFRATSSWWRTGRGGPARPELARALLQLPEERLELGEIGEDLVHLAQRACNLDQRARRVRRERLESLLRTLKLAAEDHLARPALLGELP
jgi:signal transduction histidine kinase